MPLLRPDYPEQTVSLMIQMFLTLVSSRDLRFTIELFTPHRERWLGADARLLSRIQGIRPFYMQFKRPFGWTGESRSSVIKDRRNLGRAVDPLVLFFELRDKTSSQPHYQHNVLHRLRRRLLQRRIGDAAYVCPLFLSQQNYVLEMHRAALEWFDEIHPFRWRRLMLNSRGSSAEFASVPTIMQHVSIPAHLPVNDAKHFYSFLDDGTDVCFHFPEYLSEGSIPLADWLSGLVPSNASPLIYAEESERALAMLLEELELDSRTVFEDPERTGFERWFSFGEFLSRMYGIEQYAFVRWSES